MEVSKRCRGRAKCAGIVMTALLNLYKTNQISNICVCVCATLEIHFITPRWKTRLQNLGFGLKQVKTKSQNTSYELTTQLLMTEKKRTLHQLIYK